MNDNEVLALTTEAFPGDIDRAAKVMDRYLLAHPDASPVVLWRVTKSAIADEDRIAEQHARFLARQEKRDNVFPPGGYVGGGS